MREEFLAFRGPGDDLGSSGHGRISWKKLLGFGGNRFWVLYGLFVWAVQRDGCKSSRGVLFEGGEI